jgi:hypothetical protein
VNGHLDLREKFKGHPTPRDVCPLQRSRVTFFGTILRFFVEIVEIDSSPRGAPIVGESTFFLVNLARPEETRFLHRLVFSLKRVFTKLGLMILTERRS